jgi:hypothetical protein
MESVQIARKLQASLAISTASTTAKAAWRRAPARRRVSAQEGRQVCFRHSRHRRCTVSPSSSGPPVKVVQGRSSASARRASAMRTWASARPDGDGNRNAPIVTTGHLNPPQRCRSSWSWLSSVTADHGRRPSALKMTGHLNCDPGRRSSWSLSTSVTADHGTRPFALKMTGHLGERP